MSYIDGFVVPVPAGKKPAYREMAGTQAIGRMGRPDEVANLALYLCSEESAFVTGQAYPIDGGVTTV